MKKAALAVVLSFITIFFVVIILCIYTRDARTVENANSLSEAVDSTLSALMNENSYKISSTEEFTADFIQALCLQMNSESDLKVTILGADYEKGLLSVETVQTFTYANGRKGTVADVRTVLFERTEEGKEKQYTVTYLNEDGSLYKSYTVGEGSTFPIPAAPEREVKTFGKWTYQTGGTGNVEAVQYTTEQGRKKQVIAMDGQPRMAADDISAVAVYE